MSMANSSHKSSSQVNGASSSKHDQGNMFEKQMERKTRIISHDLSKGQENFPIRVVNEVDDEEPEPFTYVTEWFLTRFYEHPEAEPCDCIGGCSNARPCVCTRKNKHKKIPYRKDGSVINTGKKLIIYECGPKCKCPPSCRNRVGQHGLQFPLELFKTPSKGWGVRPLVDIATDKFICEYFGEILDDDESEQRSNNMYFFDIGDEDGDGCLTIDGLDYGNVAKFINHSCSPNVISQKVLHDHANTKACRVMFFAIKDIPALTELTYDYGYEIDGVLDADGNVKTMECRCGFDNCIKRLY